MCNIAARKWDVSGVTVHKCRVGFGFLLDNGSCYLSVAQWLAQQNPTVESSVRPPGRAEHTPVNFCNIMSPLLATNDGRSGMLN